MSGLIVTARHGRPDVDRTVKITAREYGFWWANYDKTGLAPGQEPPDRLLEIASGAQVILCSTLPRSIETADKVVKGAKIVPQDAMFVEAPLPAPPIPSFIRLTPTTWGVISRMFWFIGYAPKGCENHFRAQRRVRRVADRLVSEAMQADGDVLLCAHGYLNWMIHRVLVRRGWALVDHQGGNHYWSHRAYRKQVPATPEPSATTQTSLAAE